MKRTSTLLLALLISTPFQPHAFPDLGDHWKTVHVTISLTSGKTLEGMAWGVAGGYNPDEEKLRYVTKGKDGKISVQAVDSSLDEQTFRFDWQKTQAVRLGTLCGGIAVDFLPQTEPNTNGGCGPSIEIWRANENRCLPPRMENVSLANIQSIRYRFKVDKNTNQQLWDRFILSAIEDRCRNSVSYTSYCQADTDSVVHTYFEPKPSKEDPVKVRNIFRLSATVKGAQAECASDQEIVDAFSQSFPAQFQTIRDVQRLSDSARKTRFLKEAWATASDDARISPERRSAKLDRIRTSKDERLIGIQKDILRKRIKLIKEELSIYQAMPRDPEHVPNQEHMSHYSEVMKTLNDNIETAEQDLKRGDPGRFRPLKKIAFRMYKGPHWSTHGDRMRSIIEEGNRISTATFLISSIREGHAKELEALRTEVKNAAKRLETEIDPKLKKWVVLDGYLPVLEEENWFYPSLRK